jgi:tight adherence protein B
VASALRSGQPPASAWRSVLGCPVGPDGVPGLEDLLEATVRGSSGARAVLFRVLHGHAPPGLVARSGATSHQLATLARRATAVVAGGRLATTLGAPLAPVLDRVAESIVADDEVDGERRAALAGPRSTAAVLGWLPLLGVALGIALGADPLGVVLRGGIGTASAVVGCGLLVAGRWWTSRLVNRAALVGRS